MAVVFRATSTWAKPVIEIAERRKKNIKTFWILEICILFFSEKGCSLKDATIRFSVANLDVLDKLSG
jgi:hypothetical protein